MKRRQRRLKAMKKPVSAVTGVFFGFCSARKAAALDPIDALRFE